MGLKSNRLVNKPHIQICKLDIPDEGLKVHLNGYGWIKIFRFAGKNRRMDYIGTSRLDLTKEQIKLYFERRWSIEVMHRELKQTCRFSRCQFRTGRAGRNHIGLSLLALVRKHRRRCFSKSVRMHDIVIGLAINFIEFSYFHFLVQKLF